MLRSTAKHTKSIVGEVVNSIVHLYRVNHCSCFLYLGSILVDIYGPESDFRHGVSEMMQVFTREAFEFVHTSCGGSVENVSELRKLPDTVDDFFAPLASIHATLSPRLHRRQSHLHAHHDSSCDQSQFGSS